MSVRILTFSITLLILFGCATAQTTTKSNKLAIMNGRANYLPRPDYPQEAKDFCAAGKVEVEVEISEGGDVLSAKSISGDELLQSAAVEAAKKATFDPTPSPPKKTNGIVVYNFDSMSNCIKLGVVNKKALKLPKPKVRNIIHPRHLRLNGTEVVEVQIVIDIWTGKVINARAVSGHPMLRGASVLAAHGAKFAPTMYNGGPIKVKANLVYKYKPDGSVEL